jgi:FtsZ-binding cell division protein ZapB
MGTDDLRHKLNDVMNNLVDAVEKAEEIAANANIELTKLKNQHKDWTEYIQRKLGEIGIHI